MDFRTEVLSTVLESLDVKILKELKQKQPQKYQILVKLVKDSK